MIHKGFAQLGNFIKKTENYEFQSHFYLNSESLLVGQESKILICPKLFINGRKASVGLLEKSQAILRVDHFIDQSITSKTIDIDLKDDEESVISFQVTPNIRRLSVQVKTTI